MHTIAEAMAESVEQHGFYGSKNMFFMAADSVTHCSDNDFHDLHI